MWVLQRKIPVHRNGCKYILLRINVCFTEYLLATEIDEKKHVDRDFIFEVKKQEALEKNLIKSLLELIQVSIIMKILKLVEVKH